MPRLKSALEVEFGQRCICVYVITCTSLHTSQKYSSTESPLHQVACSHKSCALRIAGRAADYPHANRTLTHGKCAPTYRKWSPSSPSPCSTSRAEPPKYTPPASGTTAGSIRPSSLTMRSSAVPSFQKLGLRACTVHLKVYSCASCAAFGQQENLLAVTKLVRPFNVVDKVHVRNEANASLFSFVCKASEDVLTDQKLHIRQHADSMK